LLLALAVSLASGSAPIAWSSLLGSDPGGETSRLLFWQLRFPRVLTAAAVGASLAVVGAVLQTLLRNPLADPFLIGVSSASATGTVLALAAGWTDARFGFAAVAALLTLLFLDSVAFRHQRFSDHHLLIAGVALTYLFSAITGLVVALSKPETTRGLLFWLMGGFSDHEPLGTGLSLLVLVAASVFLARRAGDLDLLAAGDETSHVLGLRPHKLRRQLFLVCSLLVGVAVATAGGIGFVGVLVPHLARLSCGVSHRSVLLLSAVGGAALTTASDTVARTILAPQEIPVGLITALLGAPFFLYQLHRGRGL
jgi:iron complex transport system permease protein